MFFGQYIYIPFVLQGCLLTHLAESARPWTCVELSRCPKLNNIFNDMTAQAKYIAARMCHYNPSNINMELSDRFYVWCPLGDDLRGNILPDSRTCGQAKGTLRIMSGKEADLNGFPWIALILYRNQRTWKPDPTTICAGSLINSRYVLTAAHCLKGREVLEKDSMVNSVRLGEHNTATNPDCVTLGNGKRICASRHLEVDVEEQIVHEDYVNDGKNINDIALLRLAFPVRYTEAIQPICVLPGPDYLNHYFVNHWKQQFKIAGWGTSHKQGSHALMQGNINGSNPIVCQKNYRTFSFRPESQICAGGQDGTDTCKGDSGGPLMATIGRSVNEFVYLAGITSYGGLTCGMYPAVYTRTEKFIGWIQRNLRT
ncbi:spaetzle-processing enzyme-like isoform X1 [Drosophila gunungcola]|uniref:spaetzle-processing enzyme-like isoform X1 n=2 Tax=Drosophila gunungcola TaxID=103775 RepID=UPI0022E83206|nr:spaetzle-processing enzyme-like isoform X1 [Drosophila gunungcola]